MNPLRSILVVMDENMTHGRALQRGAQLARLSGAQLQLCMIAYDPRIAVPDVDAEVLELARRAYLEERRNWLREVALEVREERIDCEVIWAQDFSRAFLDKVLELQPDLVLKDRHQEPALRRLLVTPLDWRVLRYCPAPLMQMAAQGPVLPRRIAAAVDTATEVRAHAGLNHRILQAALDQAGSAGAELHAVSAYPFLGAFAGRYPEVAQAVAVAELQHRQALEELAAAAGLPEAHRHALQGETVHTLNEFVSEQQIDLLVIGSIYRKGFDRLMLGSTAEALASQARCDLLLIKPASFAAELRQALAPRFGPGAGSGYYRPADRQPRGDAGVALRHPPEGAAAADDRDQGQLAHQVGAVGDGDGGGRVARRQLLKLV